MTKKQRETLKYVTKFMKAHERKPTVIEVCDYFNLSSTASGWERLDRMNKAQDKCPYCLREF